MALRFYNTLTRSVQEFVPLDPAGHRVGLYCCGPTVYDYAHIGNWRTFVFADLVRRTLEFNGCTVRHVMNITDVEDKIIKRVRETKTTLRDFTGRYEAAFLEDLQTLGCRRPHLTPRATEHIPEMLELIGRLIERGLAYKAADGSVYFSIEKYRGCGCQYGQLVKLNLDEMRMGERVASDEYEKESVADFALWKARVPEDGDVFWPSPWGEGRPGWHIECSAMSLKYLGENFDIHGGGLDLQFPHHEAEIAQAEAAGHPFARYWMHNNMVTVGGEKMSKSKGNFTTLKDLFAQHDPMVVRFLLVSSHYRSVTEFSNAAFESARSGYKRLTEALHEVERRLPTAPERDDPVLRENIARHVREFENAMRDDFNTPRAVAALFGLTADVNAALNAGNTGREALTAARDAYRTLGGGVLGLFAEGRTEHEDDSQIVNALMELVLQARQHYRLNKKYAQADKLRDTLAAVGVTVEDTREGPRWRR